MTGLYIHIPFCKRKCFYCDFFSVGYSSETADSYVNALLKEAQSFKDEKIETVYIGGGTPSVLDCTQIDRLILKLNSIFDLSSVKEFTFEANPESLDCDKLKLLFNLGITRLSLGLQTADDSQLKILGRLHNYEKFLSVFDVARNVGFKNINIDLMYGIPQQSLDSWKQNLKCVVNLKPEHISLYPLTVEPTTPFYRNGVTTDGNLQSEMFGVACLFLKENNFCHYEISNWAKDENFSNHNILYWHNQEYVGLGTSASSYYKRHRYKNVADINKYIDAINNGKSVVCENEYIDDKLYNTEKIMLGLRLAEGVELKYFENKKDVLEKYLSCNMMKIKNDRVCLSPEAVFVSNGIIADFI